MIYVGDCIEVMKTMEPGTIDSIVTDPPYGLAFMGKSWDTFDPAGFQEFSRKWGAEALRVAKPGAFLLAFSGTRTYHRMACGLEDAGWLLRDMMTWNYGSGFPKSFDIAKGFDRKRYERDEILQVTGWIRSARDAAGVTNAQIDEAFGMNGMAGHWTSQASQPSVPTLEQVPKLLDILGAEPPPEIERLMLELNGRKGEPGDAWFQREKIGEKSGINTKEQTPAVNIGAQGMGASTRHTFDITAPATEMAQKWEGWGTALKPSIEPIVVAMKPLDGKFTDNAQEHGVAGLWINGARIETDEADDTYADKWPANSIFDTEAGALLDGQAGGNISRIFYCPKASREEREAGILSERKRKKGWSSGEANPGSFQSEGTDRTSTNHHPTVKPVDLMRYLVRITRTPTGGTVLDPFTGSGTTGVACKLERRPFIGIEMDPEFAEISRQRIAHHAHPEDEDYRPRVSDDGQAELFG